MGYTLQFGQIAHEIPYLLGGIWPTLWISFVTFWIAAAMGLGLAFARIGGGPVLRRAAKGWIFLFTFTPVFLLLFALFNVLPDVGMILSPIQATLIAFTLNSSAYLAEIERGGIVSVRQGELDSAAALGMSGWQTALYVIVPHVAKTTYAPMANWFILTVLGTSMASLIGVDEVTGRALAISSRTFRSLEVFIVVGAVYVGLTIVASLALALVGRYAFRVKVKIL